MNRAVSKHCVKLVTLLKAYCGTDTVEDEEDEDESLMEDDIDESAIKGDETMDKSNTAISCSRGNKHIFLLYIYDFKFSKPKKILP